MLTRLVLLDLLEPSPSPPTVPGPASAMPNFSRPRASGSGNSPLQFLGHFRNRSTDTIVHNPAKSPDRERHSAAGYPTPRKSQEPGPGRRRRQPEEEEEGKEVTKGEEEAEGIEEGVEVEGEEGILTLLIRSYSHVKTALL